MEAPPAPAGPEPSLALTYNSQSVDGKTASTNNQPSAVGEGWELSGGGFIERRYVTCSKDDTAAESSSGDLCWRSDNATLSFGSMSGPLIRDSASGAWKLQSDENVRVERLIGSGAGCSPNGTYNDECWRLTTPDGTQYFFGLNRLPGWTAGKAETKSAWTVPVFGNSPGEPCNNAAGFAASSCLQGWRWNLDYVVDVHGNAMALYYNAETNKYLLNGTAVTTYTRGGSIASIETGLKSTTVYAANAATGRVEFTYDVNGRCNDTVLANCSAQPTNGLATTPTNTAKYPDVPYDQNCTGSTCAGLTTPSFWSVARLQKVTTKTLIVRDPASSSSYDKVDEWALNQSFPDPGDGTNAALWLTQITHTGWAGTTSLSEPAVQFAGIAMQNRVWVHDGLVPLDKYRISSVRLETGAVISVNYSAQDCAPAEVPTILANVQNNFRRCFPQWWTPDTIAPVAPQQDLFHKYLVTSTVANPVNGGVGAVPVETYYDYSAGSPAWRYNDSPFTPAAYRTWSNFAGYDRVEIRTGSPTAPTTQQVSQYWFFRGLDGDRAAPSGGTKTVAVTGFPGVVDSEWLAGRTYQVKTLNGVGGSVTQTTVTTPWSSPVKANNGDEQARLVRDGTVSLTVPLSTGGNRVTQTVTSYDSRGFPTSVSQENETGAVSTCTTYEYASDNPSAWIIGLVKQSLTVAKNCSTTPTLPADHISGEQIFYDSSGTLGAAPTMGMATKSKVITAYAGISPTWTDVSTSVYDTRGRPIQQTDALGRTTTTSYVPNDAAGAGSGPLSSVATSNALGWLTTSLYEPTRGNITQVTDPNNLVTSAAYDALGRTVSVWATDRPKTSNPVPTVAYTYTQSTTAPLAVATTTLTPSTTKTIYSLFDGLGRPVQTQAPAVGGGSAISDIAYDTAGRTSYRHNPYWSSATAPSGTLFVPSSPLLIPSRLEYTYDGVGRTLVERLVSTGTEHSRTTTSFLGADRVDVDPPDGATPSTTLTNSLGQATSLVQYLDTAPNPLATQIETTYTYGVSGAMTSMTDEAGNDWEWTYDVLGRKTAAEDPDSGNSEYTYDLAGRMLTSEDGRGVVTAKIYDPLDRLIEVREGSATGTLLSSWAYDTLYLGQLSSSTSYVDGDAYTKTVNTYDTAYRPTKTTISIPSGAPAFAGTTHVEELTYYQDGSSNVLKLPAIAGLPAENLKTSYTSMGLPSGLTGSTYYAATVGYTATGKLSSFTRTANAYMSTTYGYDAATTAMMSIADSTKIGGVWTNTSTRAYTRNQAGGITSSVTTAASLATNTECFGYDYLQNLTQAWTPSSGSCAAAPTSTGMGGPAPYWTTWNIDPVTGNRDDTVSQPVTSGGVATTRDYTYPTAGSLRPHAVGNVATAVGTGTPTTDLYTYDAAGNTTGRPGQTLTYDALGRVSEVVTGSATQSNVYTADGVLLMRTETGVGTTLFLGITELTSSDAPTPVVSGLRTYSFGGMAIAERTGSAASTLRWLSTDLVGTSEVSVGSTGAATYRYMDPFGVPVGSPSWPNNHGYLNAPKSSATGLTRLGAREYDPDLGRFVSVDAVLSPGSPQQNNGYSYSNNNPVTMSDPSGKLCGGTGGGGGGSHAHFVSCSTNTVPDGQTNQNSSTPPAAGDSGEDSQNPWEFWNWSEDQWQDAAAVGAGVLVGTVIVLAAGTCTAVTFGVCGAVILGAAVVGGAAAGVVTYHLSSGEKTGGGYAEAALWGAAGGLIGGMLGPLVGAVIKPAAAAIGSKLGLVPPAVEGLTYAAPKLAPSAASSGADVGAANRPPSTYPVPIGPGNQKAWTVLNRVDEKGAPLPGYKGGSVFGNNKDALPPGQYREWDLDPKVPGVDRNAERIVTGADGSAYYTGDHYISFVMLRGSTE